MNKEKVVFVTHCDLDGISPLVLLDYFDLKFDELYSWNYDYIEDDESIKKLREATSIIMVDLHMPEELFLEFIKEGIKIEIYDHHDTSSWLSEKYANQGYGVHDQNRCGTKIFFEEYIAPKVKRYKRIVQDFVNIVDAYDRWVLDSKYRPLAEDLQRVWLAYANWNEEDGVIRHDRFVTQTSKKLDKFTEFSFNSVEQRFIDEGKAKEQKAYSHALKNMQVRKDNRGRKFGVWQAWGKISNTASLILQDTILNLDYVIGIQTYPSISGQLSVRCLEDKFQAPWLAGVNGHLAAAGAIISEEEANTLYYEEYCFKYAEDWEENTSQIERCIEIESEKDNNNGEK